jgi:anti-sigma regulatory factor (Ser/Thr protein kinase)
MESILRGAMGRIDAYQRIRVHSVSSAAVAGYAAEGVMHALAELMDNAAAFSAHGSEVHVYVEDEDVGVVVTIEDSGLGMRKRERQRAEGLVSQAFDLTTLPGTRMGLAVVGRLARRYGLTVNFRPSSRGGSGVVVMVPRQLIAQPRVGHGPARNPAAGVEPEPVLASSAGAPGPAAAPELAAAPAGPPGPPGPAGPAAGDDPDQLNLPKRPRGVTLAAASRAQGPPPSSAPAPVDRSARFAAFRQTGERNRSGPTPTPPPPAGPESQ